MRLTGLVDCRVECISPDELLLIIGAVYEKICEYEADCAATGLHPRQYADYKRIRGKLEGVAYRNRGSGCRIVPVNG